jgi:hypothetical protein
MVLHSPIARNVNPKIIRWLVSLGIGFCVASSCGYHFFDLWIQPIFAQVLCVIGLTLLFAFITSAILARFILPHLTEFSQRSRVSIMLIALLCGAFLTLVIPLSEPPWRTLEIVATGEKNDRAQASLVILWQIIQANGQRVPLSEMYLSGDWQVTGNDTLAADHSASVVWLSQTEYAVALDFPTHPNGGIALVRWDGVTQRVDLYAPMENAKPIRVWLGETDWTKRTPKFLLLTFAFYLIDTITLGFFLLSVLSWLLSRSSYLSTLHLTSRSRWLWYALPCVLVWSIYLVAFFPALMSQDSIDQWQQAMGITPLNDWHPPITAGIYWLAWRIFGSPAAVALAQIVVTAMLIAYGLKLLEQAGVPRWVCWGSSILAAIIPVNGLMLITLWKDIPYAIDILGLTILLLQMVLRPERAERMRFWLAIGVLSAFLALVRHNGFFVGFGLPIVMLFIVIIKAQKERTVTKPWYQRAQIILQSRRVRNAFLVCITSVSIYLVVIGPIYDLFAVKRMQMTSAILVVTATGLFKNSDAQISPAEKQTLQRMNSEATGRLARQSTSGDTLEEMSQLANLVMRNPSFILKYLSSSTGLVWRLTQPTNFTLYLTPAIGNPIEANRAGLVPTPIDPDLTIWLTEMIRDESESGWIVLWRPALYLFLGLLGVAVGAWRTSNQNWWVVCLPVILQSLGMLPASVIAQDVRFMYPVQLAAFLLVTCMFLPRSNFPTTADSNRVLDL